jgi:peptide/nickel transport system permease protein
MLRYVIKRVLLMIPTLIAISIIVFTIIQLPPGNYLESYIAELQAQGESIDPQKIAFLREYYGLDKPLIEQYFLGGRHAGRRLRLFVRVQLPVSKVIGDRMLLTIIVSGITILFTWAIAFPIGIYSATHQYSWGDYGLSLLGFLGIAIPNFMLALVMMYLANVWFGTSIGGLMAPEFIGKPWTWAKARSVLEHSWIPVIVIGTHSTAGMIRRLRANLLDELQKQYVVTARAKGLPPRKVLFKYPLRMALNFFISDIGACRIIPGPDHRGRAVALHPRTRCLNALKSQDVYLAGSFLMFLALMIVIGVLVSDLALMALDPRIRLAGGVAR